MTTIEDRIESGLGENERQIWDEQGELDYMKLGLSQFQGKNAWVSWVMMLTQLIFFVGGIYCAVKFYGATDSLLAIKYGITMAVLWVMAFQMKMSFLPQMQADRVLRELKRVELLAARGK